MRNLIRGLIAAVSLAALPAISDAGVLIGVSVNIAPPVLPVYVQPPCPAVGYIWIPGYWAWGEGDYYWVPGTWALAPSVGLLWTPGYWGWGNGVYLWNAGYWGPHVGFYGGINYGFGYGGRGYEGGYWRGSQFYYNRSVTNISNTNITNVYNRTVVNNVTVNRVSFNGGAGGVAARPAAAELRAAREQHVGLTPVQREHEQKARGETTLRASVNGGRPPIAATRRPATFSGGGVVAARGAPAAGHTPAAAGRAPVATNRSDRPPQAQRPAMSNRAGVPPVDRPPQAQHPVPMVNQQFRERGNAAAPPPRSPSPGVGRAGPEAGPRGAPGYPQARGPAQPGGAPAPQGAARERQAAPRPSGERQEDHGRGR
jgi:hypothetical protein